METFDQNDLPIHENAKALRAQIVPLLTLRKRRFLFASSACALLVGVSYGIYVLSPTAISRTGAMLILLSLGHAYAGLKWSRMMSEAVIPTLVKIFTDIELDKMDIKNEGLATAIANKRVKRSTPDLVEAVNREFVRDHLLIAAAGTVLWGWGDLIPLRL